MHTWHWVSSAISLIGLLLFAFTGFTLNHAAEIEGAPTTEQALAHLPPALARLVAPSPSSVIDPAERALPVAVARWLEDELGTAPTADADWSEDEVYLAMPRPGGDGWIAIDRATGRVTSETTSRGWISYLNDLHKGRNTGTTWAWFIDGFAIACFIFALTGLLLLHMHAARRPSTWPLVAAGLLLPVLLAMAFIH